MSSCTSGRLSVSLNWFVWLCICIMYPPEIVMHDDAYIDGRSENNIKCVLHDDLGRKNRTTRYNCRFSAASLALRVIFSVHSCGTYSVLSRSPSIVSDTAALSCPYYLWKIAQQFAEKINSGREKCGIDVCVF